MPRETLRETGRSSVGNNSDKTKPMATINPSRGTQRQ